MPGLDGFIPLDLHSKKHLQDPKKSCSFAVPLDGEELPVVFLVLKKQKSHREKKTIRRVFPCYDAGRISKQDIKQYRRFVTGDRYLRLDGTHVAEHLNLLSLFVNTDSIGILLAVTR